MDSTTLNNMLHLDPTVLEKVARPIIVYLFLIVGLRLAGKRELAQMNTFDLVVLLMLSNTVQNAIIGNDNSVTGGLIGAAALLLLNALIVRFVFRHDGLRQLAQGTETVLMDRGHLVVRNMDRENISEGELEMAARKEGHGSLRDIERAVLEPGGGIGFIVKPEATQAARQREIIERLAAIEARLARLGVTEDRGAANSPASGMPASGGPPSGGPASGGPASGGPASGGPASGAAPA
ncbi:MAG TPA: YetF domain-containing protein [Candidatus Kapabacteria bacterium]|nr:YetF domain-containing protein [Candidatus Kapabacteria bacterium]